MKLMSDLCLYIPGHGERDVQSKLTVIWSNSNFRNGRGSKYPKKRYMRWDRLYQCQCGADHASGHNAAKEKRQIPWKNVGCLCWVKLVTLHDIQNSMYHLVLL